MGLIDQARADILTITTNANEFAVPVVFTSPFGDTVTVNAMAKKHHLGVNNEGVAVNTKTATVTVSEYALSALLYPFRNNAGEVSLRNHKVSWSDTGGQHSYVIAEQFPDETIGLIVCLLRDFV